MPNVLVPLANGCEELEAVTIIDLLRRAGIDVTTASLEAGTIVASRGTRLVADCTLEQARSRTYDMIALPGGLPGADHLRDDHRVIEIIRDTASAGKYVSAICAAPKVLIKAGVLEGKKATFYPGALTERELATIIPTDEAVVVDGRVVTSKGPGTAMDFALTLIELLSGRGRRDQVEEALQRPDAG